MANPTSSKSTPNPSEKLCVASAQLSKTTSCQIKSVSAPQSRKGTATPPSTQQNVESTTLLTKETLKMLQSQEHSVDDSISYDDDDDSMLDAMLDNAMLDDTMGDSEIEDIASRMLTNAAPDTRVLFEMAQGCLDESSRVILGKRKQEDARDLIAAISSDDSEPETTHKRVRGPNFPSKKEAAMLVEATRKLAEAKNEGLQLLVLARIVLSQMDKNHPYPDEPIPSTNTPTTPTNPILATSPSAKLEAEQSH
ncbi:hypothetical protein EDD21DRAFT_361987 [Dissophora ornata]|nr:hypothetical protein EDD21DRAFT_361987 [Dissophora ornata]